jgi:hypothetical protein
MILYDEIVQRPRPSRLARILGVAWLAALALAATAPAALAEQEALPESEANRYSCGHLGQECADEPAPQAREFRSQEPRASEPRPRGATRRCRTQRRSASHRRSCSSKRSRRAARRAGRRSDGAR